MKSHEVARGDAESAEVLQTIRGSRVKEGWERTTETGGRAASTRHIPPLLALAVGMPSTPAPSGWQWVPLTEVARLESGHTPSRRHPEYWGGAIPWIGIMDARTNHGGVIHETIEYTNDVGIAHSSARILPKNTVCLSRTASVGYVLVMGRPMATSQDFVNWVCSATELHHDFLKYLFIAEGKDLLRFASGAVHQTIYFPEAKAFHICLPPLPEQQRIVRILDEAFAAIATAKANAERNLKNARALFESYLESVFSQRGEGWEEGPLAEVVDKNCTLSYEIVQPGTDHPNGLPVVRPTDLTAKEIGLNGLKRIDPRLAKAYKRTELRGGELLLCVRGSTGAISIASLELKGANVTRGIVPIFFDESRLRQDFGYYLMNSDLIQKQIREKTYGAALMQINIRDLRQILLSFPHLQLQRELAEKWETLAVESQRLESIYKRKVAALDELKKSLLQQAFKGEL